MSASNFHFDPPERILLGPGPSNVSARVLAALARPTVGYLDPFLVALLEHTTGQLQRLFRTDNPGTFAVTGSGTAAMECALYNLVEPGERAIACVHGYFGDRMRQILARAGAELTVIEGRWGAPTDPEAVRAALRAHPDTTLVAIVHGETSTGVLQPLVDIAREVRDAGAMLVADTVASLGGVEFETDAWGIDVAYTGAQKCLSAPPGCSPITFSPRALERITARREPVRSWYLDAPLNLGYWQRPHGYHHTVAINLIYALHEALATIEDEGLAVRIARTRKTAGALWAGLEALGLELLVAEPARLPTLTCVLTPEGIDEAAIRGELLARHGIEIAGALGSLRGRAWRIGLMGTSCTARNVLLLLAALESALASRGHSLTKGAAVTAAEAVLASP